MRIVVVSGRGAALAGALPLAGAILLAGCAPMAPERRPTDTTSVSAPLDAAKPVAGLQPEPITVPPSPQFTTFNTLRTNLNGGASALEAGDKEKAGSLLAAARTSYDAEFAEAVKASDTALHDRIINSYDAMKAAVGGGDAAAYRFNRYTADVGLIRLATLRARDALERSDKADAEQWFSIIANRFDLSKDIQPVGAAWKRVQNGPIDAATRKAFNQSLAAYLATKVRGELKGAAGGLDEGNRAKARWEASGGVAYFDAIREVHLQIMGPEGSKKFGDALQALDAAIVRNDDAAARAQLAELNTQLDAFDKAVTAG